MIRTGEREAGQWREASWAEAYDYIAERMTRIAERDGWRANAWLGMTGNYGARAQTSKDRAANTLGGTLFTNGGLMSDLAGMLGLSTTLGALISSNEVADIVHSKYMLFAGRNTADTGHSEMHFVFDALENGAKLAVIDPRFSRTAAKADEWLPLRPGTDVALVLGMLNVLISERLIKTDYVRDHTNSPFLVREDTGAMLRERDLLPTGGEGYLVWDEAVGKPVLHGDAKAALVRGSWEVAGVDGSPIVCHTAFDALWSVWSRYTPEAAEKICGVPADQIRRVAREYATN
jgi:anaerobic selenocysteine-containing dehydrogenase